MQSYFYYSDPVNSPRETRTHSIQTSHPESSQGQPHMRTGTCHAPCSHQAAPGPTVSGQRMECACQNLLSKVDTLRAWSVLGNLGPLAHGGSQLPSAAAAHRRWVGRCSSFHSGLEAGKFPRRKFPKNSQPLTTWQNQGVLLLAMFPPLPGVTPVMTVIFARFLTAWELTHSYPVPP